MLPLMYSRHVRRCATHIIWQNTRNLLLLNSLRVVGTALSQRLRLLRSKNARPRKASAPLHTGHHRPNRPHLSLGVRKAATGTGASSQNGRPHMFPLSSRVAWISPKGFCTTLNLSKLESASSKSSVLSLHSVVAPSSSALRILR